MNATPKPEHCQTYVRHFDNSIYAVQAKRELKLCGVGCNPTATLYPEN